VCNRNDCNDFLLTINHTIDFLEEIRFFKENEQLILSSIPLAELYKNEGSGGLWPHGNLKITLKLTFFSPSIHTTTGSSNVASTLTNKNHLIQSFGRLLKNPEMSDVQIICGRSIFPAHKFILSGMENENGKDDVIFNSHKIKQYSRFQ
jgi:hypothetical protein